MLRSAASKVMWVGRATVFLVGLAVILALVFGAVSRAVAHTGVDTKLFHLGHGNSAGKPTSLVSTLAGAAKSALIVNNKSGGPALDLKVQAGKPPMKVNSQAEVPKLNAQFAGHADTADSATNATNATNAGNADTVDGKHAADFYAQGSKVDDSEELDGMDSTDFAAKAEAPGFDAQTVTTLTTLNTTLTNIATITVTAPADGFVILTGNGVFRAKHTNGQGTSVRAYVGTAQALSVDNLTIQGVPASAPSGDYSVPFSITRVFPVTAGENTFQMAADVTVSGGGEIVRHNLTGVFIKNQF